MYITDNINKIKFVDVKKLLLQTDWAKKREDEYIYRCMMKSVCFIVFDDSNTAVGFARVVTDYCTVFYICDVVVDSSLRKQGIGTQLIQRILNDDRWSNLTAVLSTKDAHTFYEKFGFVRDGEKFMYRKHE